jgi:hypothetical protein
LIALIAIATNIRRAIAQLLGTGGMGKTKASRKPMICCQQIKWVSFFFCFLFLLLVSFFFCSSFFFFSFFFFFFLVSFFFFSSLKSGCRIEALQLEKRERLEPALAFDMIIVWRVLHLSMLGRECPEMPCNRVFSDEAWQALYLVIQRQPPPDEPPSLDTIVRMVATLGGFLNRKHHGFPGPQTLWISLQRTADFVLALGAQRSIGESYG